MKMPIWVRIPVLLLATTGAAGAAFAAHPALYSQTYLNSLASGDPAWPGIKAACDGNLNLVIEPDYAGWGYRTYGEDYGLCYQVALKTGDPAATIYEKKALGLLHVLAHDHVYGSPNSSQFIGFGDGSTTSFPLPATPLSGAPITVYLAGSASQSFTYGSPANLPAFGLIGKISNTPTGGADYPASAYELLYHDPVYGIAAIVWTGATHPANGSSYYVTYYDGNPGPAITSGFSVQGGNIVFTTPPAAGQMVFVHYVFSDYGQTGNGLGGASACQPDGPGYTTRTFAVGLGELYDLLFNAPDLTSTLRSDYVAQMNSMLDWAKDNQYDRDVSSLGNYHIEGIFAALVDAAYGMEEDNARTPDWKTAAAQHAQGVHDAMTTVIPGGFGPQGDYTAGTYRDLLAVFDTLKNATGVDYMADLAWKDNVIPALIHATGPNRLLFCAEGDWTTLPPQTMTETATNFLKYFPNHAAAPYARQYLQDAGVSFSPGPMKDYKTDYPLSYNAPTAGGNIMFARSDWGTNAVWLHLTAMKTIMDHQHRSQGSFEITRGSDQLLVNAGGYGMNSTVYNNTFLIDDRGAGDISTYPPDQALWGGLGNKPVSIRKYMAAADFVYAQTEFSDVFVRAAGGTGAPNSVQNMVRSLIYIRPDLVIVNDAVEVANANVKTIFNLNFANTPSQTGNMYTMTRGNSKLFMRELVPASATPVIAPIQGDGITSANFQLIMNGTDNSFLHVFQATDKSVSSMDGLAYVQSSDQLSQGVEVQTGGKTWAVMSSVSGNVLTGVVRYTVTSVGSHEHVVGDLQPNTIYKLTVVSNGVTIVNNVDTPTSPQGVARFSFTAPAQAQVILSSTGQPADITPPAAPGGLKVCSSSPIGLCWDANKESDLAGYNLYRAAGSATIYDKQNAALLTNTQMTDFRTTSGVTYHYYATAVDTSGNESPASLIVDATGVSDTTPPAAPRGLTLDTASGTPTLHWSPNTEADLSGYAVYRAATAAGPFSRLANTSLTSYDDVQPIRPASYRITAIDKSGNESAPSDIVSTAGAGDASAGTLHDIVFFPGRGQTAQIPVTLDKAGHVRVAVFDRFGGTVVTLLDDDRDAGLVTVQWDGRDGSHELVPSGVYALLIDVPGAHHRKKIVVVK